MRRRSPCLLLALVLTAAGHTVAHAADPAFFPAVAVRAPAWRAVPPRPTLPAHTWSDVLTDVPLPPGAALAFFEVRPDAVPPAATAWYAAPLSGSELAGWYVRFLPLFGWRLVWQDGEAQEWARLGDWLTVAVPERGAAPATVWLARAPEHVRPSRGRALTADVPLPVAARRWRYDPADLFSEEVRWGVSVAVARDVMRGLLLAEGWSPGAASRLGEAAVITYQRDDRTLGLAFSALSGALTELGLGVGTCPAVPTSPGAGTDRATSVYLDAVPAPPDAEIVSFDRHGEAGIATERWRATCHDLDLEATAFRSRLPAGGWEVDGNSYRRWPGALALVVRPVDDSPPVTCTLQAGGDGLVDVELQRAAAGCRVPDGRSLLFDDLPVPGGSVAARLATGGEWAFEETYELRGGADNPAAWYRETMRGLGWQFDRLEPSGRGPDQVYYGGGEEVVIAFDLGTAPAVRLARRRVCPGDSPVPPSGPAEAARHMGEMSVYPGAVFEAFSGTEEAYRVTCVGLDVLGGWYRSLMERGDWALAGTVGPEDRFARQLLFVRPDEKGLPPERRTAWAEVRLERLWPYHIRIGLRRDPGGITPGPSP